MVWKPVYRIKSTSARRQLEYTVRSAGSKFVVEIQSSTGLETIELPERTSLEAAFVGVPDLVRVGAGVTEIETFGAIDTHSLLGLLKVERPGHSRLREGWWESAGLDVEEWLDEDDLLFEGIRVDDDTELVPRWVKVNGERGAILVKERRSAVVLFDESNESPWRRVNC